MDIIIPDVQCSILHLEIHGISPLITHAWSQKTIDEMISEQTGGAKKPKKPPRDPEAEYEATKYLLSDGRLGIPARAFKKAMVRAAKGSGTHMTDARQVFFVQGIGPYQLVPINGKPEPRTDIVRLSKGKVQPRFRCCFPEWSAELVIEYDAEAIAPAQIANLLNRAGFGVGVGDWRPEKDGDFGRFEVAKTKTE